MSVTVDVTTLPHVEELRRFAAPDAQPQAIAHDGESLWITSWKSANVYRVAPADGTVLATIADPPAKAVGGCAIGPGDLRFVVTEDDDNRFVRRCTVAGYDPERWACPDDSGSFLAYTGDALFLSQRYNGRILDLGWPPGAPRATVAVGEQIVGIAPHGDRFMLSLWLGRDRGGCVLAAVPRSGGSVEPLVRVPFAAIGLAYDGATLWTNDFKHDATVALRLP